MLLPNCSWFKAVCNCLFDIPTSIFKILFCKQVFTLLNAFNGHNIWKICKNLTETWLWGNKSGRKEIEGRKSLLPAFVFERNWFFRSFLSNHWTRIFEEITTSADHTSNKAGTYVCKQRPGKYCISCFHVFCYILWFVWLAIDSWFSSEQDQKVYQERTVR